MTPRAGRRRTLGRLAAFVLWAAPAAAAAALAIVGGGPVERLRDRIFDEYQAI
ncbi:MAG: hypothetical protein JNK46_09145, partial [Methylobacteriaceae bacterium]|nr:hypothetical protein [Methylobacteriaceae bacterium]